MFGRNRPSFQMTVEQCLSAVVVRNPEAQDREVPGGRIEVSLPYLKPWPIRIFSRRTRRTWRRRFELDETGADLWRRIDNRQTVSDLAEHLARARGVPPQQARDSMISYIHMLMVRGLAGLAVTGPDRPAPGA